MTKHIRITPEQLQKLLRLGFDALANGQLQRGAHICEDLLQIQPNLVPAHFLVGLIALESKDRKTAVQAFGSVTRLDPKHAAAWANLAKLFMSEGQVSRADAALGQAAGLNPADPLVQDLMGTVYSLMGEYESAAACYRKAVAAQPAHPPYLLNQANNQIYLGHTDTALEIFQKIIKIAPNSPQAHWSMAGARKATNTNHIDQLQTFAAQDRLNPRLQAFYYYAMGKELEDLERWDDAFTAFNRGAIARRETVEYDEASEIAMFELLQQRYTRAWLEQGPIGNPDSSPIFILGQPRTGTTLIERIVGSHSHVHAAGELQQFSLGIRRLSEHRDPKRFSAGLFDAALQVDPKKLGTVYLDTTRRMRGTTPRFIDKLPQNYLCLPLILKALPNARVIHLTRNPMDSCFSSFKQLFADAYLHSYDLGEMARHHVRYRQLMDSWRDRFKGRFLDVSYEATVAELETNARRIIDYLGLEWQDQCLNFHRQSAGVSTASAVQVREPAHTRSVNRWRRYERQLQPVIETLFAAEIDIDPPQ